MEKERIRIYNEPSFSPTPYRSTKPQLRMFIRVVFDERFKGLDEGSRFRLFVNPNVDKLFGGNGDGRVDDAMKNVAQGHLTPHRRWHR